jgi:hypothetical protein
MVSKTAWRYSSPFSNSRSSNAASIRSLTLSLPLV